MMHGNLNVGHLLSQTETTAYQSINLALAIIVALSWLEAIKFYIDRLVKNPKQKGLWILLNAFLVTLIAVVVQTILSALTKRKTKSLVLPLMQSQSQAPSSDNHTQNVQYN